MAIINTTPVKQKVYTKLSDGSLSPVSNWTLAESVEMSDGTPLVAYLNTISAAATIYYVTQDDINDVQTAIASLGVADFKKGQVLVIANTNDDIGGFVYNGARWIKFIPQSETSNIDFTAEWTN